MHGTVMSGQNLLISGDAPGTVSAYVEQKLGAPVLYVNGAAGNLAPIYSVYPDAEKRPSLAVQRTAGRSHSRGGAVDRAGDGGCHAAAAEKSSTRRKERTRLARRTRPYTRRDRGRWSLPVRFLRINDTVIWAAPVELFCEIALAVRNASPFAHTFYFGYTNGWFGYLPTAQAFAEGGYEPKTSPFTAQAEGDVVREVVTYLSGMRR